MHLIVADVAKKRRSAAGDAGAVSVLFSRFSTAWGALSSPMFVPPHPTAMGGLKGQPML